MNGAFASYSRPSHLNRIMAVLVAIAGAAVVGIAISTAGSISGAVMVAAAVLATTAIASMSCLAVGVPVIRLAEFAFFASLFFKADATLIKIDEIEDPSGLNISLTLVLAVAIYAWDVIAGVQRERVFTRAFWIVISALTIFAAVSAVFSPSPELSAYSVLSFLSTAFIGFVVAMHFSDRDGLKTLVKGIAAGVLLTGVTAAMQYTLEFPTTLPALGTGTEDELLGTQSHVLSRVPGFLRTPTEMAWVLSALLPVILAPFMARVDGLSRRFKLLLAASALAGIAGVVLSLARGSWISLVVAVAIVMMLAWLKLRPRERTSYAMSAAVAMLCGCALLAPLAPRIYDRLTSDDQGSAQIRLPLMETAFRMIDDNKLVGVGINGYRSAMTKYDESDIFVSQVFPNPVHNVFAHITAEIGIPGGVLFCLLILVCLAECVRNMTFSDRLIFALALGTAAGLVAWVISAMKEPGSLGSVRPPIRTLFLLFGITMAISRLRRKLML
jgi:O-antigen ligase